jgi:hypothetical protein
MDAHRSKPLRRSFHCSTAMMLVATLVAALWLSQTTAVDAYNCSSNHCYAKNQWQGSTTGAGTQIYIDAISVTTSPGRETNEQWILDPTSDGRCNGLCWVEAGYSYAALGNPPCDGVERYFHAAEIPVYGYVETCDISQFRAIQNSEFHQYVGCTIYATDSTHTAFMIQLTTPLGSIQYLLSLPNQFIDPSFIQVGGEISGTAGAVGYTVFMIQNYWITSAYQGVYQDAPTPYGGGNVQETDFPYTSSTSNWYALPSDGFGGAWKVVPPSP